MTSKPVGELSRRERLWRFRELAGLALGAYGLDGAQLTLIQYNENVIYRVDLPDGVEMAGKNEHRSSSRVLMRLHAWDKEDYINGEMLWLEALSREASLPVPEPIRTLDGNYTFKAVSDRMPNGRWVTLLSWLDGRQLSKGFKPQHLRSLGEVMAKMHNFSAVWKPPEEFSRPIWDWDAQLGGSHFDVEREILVDSMPKRFQEAFLIVSTQSEKAMERLGTRIDAYGLIHTDLYPENILFKAGKASLIDFEDCGYGHWMWDIAVPLGTWAWDQGWEAMRDVFFEGYDPIHSLPSDQWKLLDLFIATQHATMLLWASAFLQHDPKRADEYILWRDDSGNKLLKFFER